MLNGIIRWSLHNRLLVLIASCILTVYGIYTAIDLPVDVLPDLNRPVVTVFSESHGLAPEEVEARVTFPIESALNGATGVYRVRSASVPGLSMVFVEFDWGEEIYRARQIVSEKLQQTAASLPEDVRPVLGPVSSIMGEIMLVGLTSVGSVTPLELRTIADWTIRPRLMAIKGISQIAIIGGEKKEYQVLVDPDAMRHQEFSFHAIEASIKAGNSNTSGGFVAQGPQELLIRSRGAIQGLSDLERVAVAPGHDRPGIAPVLREIATVTVGGSLAKRGDAGVNGVPAVLLSIQKQPDADTLELTALVESELASLQTGFPEGITIHTNIFKQANFINTAISNVLEALRDGALLVAIVLFLFLLNARTAFITLTAIPLSLLSTFIVFSWFGLSINTMTLGGLAIAIGELVDDAIVDVENVFRRLRENRHRASPLDPLAVVFQASSEVRRSIVNATVIVILVFIPLFAMSGVEGRLFSPLGQGYIISILASLVVSLTVTPVLCYYLLPRMKIMEESKESWLVTKLKAIHVSALDTVFAWPRATALLATAIVLSAISVTFSLGREFLPPFNEGSISVAVISPPGTSLEESNRIGASVEKALLTIPEIKEVGRRTGRAELDEHAEGVHSTEIEAELRDYGRSRGVILSDIRELLSHFPGVVVSIGQPISHRIDHILSGVRAQIAVKIFGPDLSILREKAAEAQTVMSSVEGIVDVAVEKQVLIPQIHVNINRERAAHYGANTGELAQYVETAVKGTIVGQVQEHQQSFDVVLRLKEEARNSVEAIRKVPVDVGGGKLVPLGLLASVEETHGPNQIVREDVSRRIVVSANVAERDLVSTVTEVQNCLKSELALPEGYFISYGGQFESQVSAAQKIFLLGLLSLIGIFLVLYLHFRSSILAGQVMLAEIPFAFSGAVFGVMLSGGVISIASLVGLVTLVGIAARNGILMIDHYLHLMRVEGEQFSLSMIYRGSHERLVPVLMTALTAVLALVPILIAPGEPGREILYPVAVVIFSGLITSTLINLLVTPMLFWFGSKKIFAHAEG